MKTPATLIALMSLAASNVYAEDSLFYPKAQQHRAAPAQKNASTFQRAQLFGEGVQLKEIEDDLQVNPKFIQANQLKIKLPSGHVLDAEVINRFTTKTGSKVWIGKHSKEKTANAQLGDEESILVLRNGKLTGSLRHDGKVYQIRSDVNGKHAIAQIDMSQFAKDHDETSYLQTPSLTGLDAQRAVMAAAPKQQAGKQVREISEFDLGLRAINAAKLNTQGSSTSLKAAAPAPVADIPVIRILVNYTQGVKSKVADVDALIDLSIAETNQGYLNSNVNARVELAYKAQVNYVESGTISTDLSRYTAPTDSYMDEIHAQRNTYAADVGVLLLNYDSTFGCGQAAQIGATEAKGFAVVKYSCSTGNMSFGHELGHLYGARHNPTRDPSTTPFAYAHGYLDPNNKWRTIMSYDDCATSCPRLNYWSNPNVTYKDGGAMGNTTASNNARVLNERASVLAAFRAPLVEPNDAPVANAGADVSVRMPNSVSLAGSATDDNKPTGSSLTYTWSKVSGPGTVTVANANAANTTASFSAAGTYVLRLTVSDSLLQSSDDVTVVATANTAPVANFTATVNDLTVQLTDSSTDTDGTIASRAWNFGDGTTSTAASPSKTFASAGTYTISLTVTDNEGATHVKTASVTVVAPNVAPIANFSASVTDLSVKLTDSSSDSDGTIASRTWNFGDGTTSSDISPNKTYAKDGTYTISLTVTDNKGASNVKTASVTVKAAVVVVPDRILMQNTSGGTRSSISSGSSGAQSFKLAGTGTYKVSKVSFYVSRSSTVPDGALALTIGTSANGGAIAGSSGTLSAATVTNTSAGSTYMKITLTYSTPVTLNAGQTYYFNMDNLSTNSGLYYVDLSSSSSAFADGAYYRAGSNQSRDMRFEIVGQ